MNLTVNGEKTTTVADQSIHGLVVQLGLAGRAVAVEVNEAVVPRKQHSQTQLKEGDVVEIVTLVGGG